MSYDQLRATWAGLKSAYDFAANKYLLSGLLHNFQQGRETYLVDEVQERDAVVSMLTDFEEIVIDELELLDEGFTQEKEELASEIIEQVEPVKHEVYPFASSYLFQDFPSVNENLPVPENAVEDSEVVRKREKTFLCMVLAREQVRLTDRRGSWNGESRADLRQRLRREMGEFEFGSPSEHELRFLSTFETLNLAIREGNRTDGKSLFTGEPDEPEKVYRDFVHTFLPFLDYPDYDIEGKSEQERLRSKVIQIVRQGELNTAAAGRNILQVIREEEERILREHSTEKGFTVFSQNWHGEKSTDQFKNRIERKFQYHVATKGTQYSYSKPKFEGQEPLYLTKHTIFTEKEYSDAEDFYNRALESLIPEGHFVAVIETSNTRPYYPQSENDLLEMAKNPEYLEGAIEGIKFFETSSPPEDVISIALDNLVGEEIEVKEMLRSLRIDVLIPGLSQDEERVLRDNRERIEEEFEVKDIFDWRKKNPDDVGGYLYYLDEETENSEGDWKENAEGLIETSEEWFRATETVRN
ncbi:hypothetical protein ACM16X_01800 [Haloarcula japonica]|uniref:hypothetical protein n=1 Tax=Haloarcula japonica TaxID=29282 RepID=UPI0039F6F7E5